MNIKDTTLKHLLVAIDTVGEPEVEEVLLKLKDRKCKSVNEFIDDVVNLVCLKIDVNKSFLFLRYSHSTNKKDALLAIVYILRKHNIRPNVIINYFSHRDLKVNALFNDYFNLSDNIPYQKKLKDTISEIDKEVEFMLKNIIIK